jgi:hypothetical protein
MTTTFGMDLSFAGKKQVQSDATSKREIIDQREKHTSNNDER